MEFFEDHNTWDTISPEKHGSNDNHRSSEQALTSFERELHGKMTFSNHLHDPLQQSMQDHLARHRLPDEFVDPLSNHVHEHVNEQAHESVDTSHHFSPSLTFQGTPLMSPHALAPSHPIPPQRRKSSYAYHSPRETPSGTPQMTAQQPGINSSSCFSPSNHSEYNNYYPSSRHSTSKVTKQSPAIQRRAASIPEDEFRLGDPALDMLEPISFPAAAAPHPPQYETRESLPVGTSVSADDLDLKLRNAIAATARANSRSNSISSSQRVPSVSSRRASTTSSNRTPRIRPKPTAISSKDPSPLVKPYDSDLSGSAPEEFFLKSNYQNLVDGTHQHLGLTAADRMSSELRSKKTVHKIAEQERRNRMNTAIAKLAQILEPEDAKLMSSKAATVEKASKHILKLEQRIQELESQLRSCGVTPNESAANAKRNSDSSSSPNSAGDATESLLSRHDQT